MTVLIDTVPTAMFQDHWVKTTPHSEINMHKPVTGAVKEERTAWKNGHLFEVRDMEDGRIFYRSTNYALSSPYGWVEA